LRQPRRKKGRKRARADDENIVHFRN
jgi:hypothetical protein